jgi:RNA polymerase sigma factor (sigma-70 family)
MNNTTEEKDLIVACQQNKSDAQRLLYERLAAKMFGLCIRYVRNSDDAEELLLNGLLKVFQKINLFRFEGSFEGWVRRIMVNECLNFLRTQKSITVELSLQSSTQSSVGNWANDNLEAEDLLKLLELLPNGYRTVFNLYAIEGFSHKEIAEMLDITEGTSKSQLARARQTLQQLIIEQEKKEKIELKYG